MFSVQTPSPAPPAGNDPSRDNQLPAVQSKSTPWIQLNAVYTRRTTEMRQRAKQPLLAFSAVFLGSCSPPPLFPPWPLPKVGAGFLNFGPRARLSKKPEAMRWGFDCDKKKKKKTQMLAGFREKRDRKSPLPGLWQSTRWPGRETRSPGSRLFLKGAKYARDRSCLPTCSFCSQGTEAQRWEGTCLRSHRPSIQVLPLPLHSWPALLTHRLVSPSPSSGLPQVLPPIQVLCTPFPQLPLYRANSPIRKHTPGLPLGSPL